MLYHLGCYRILAPALGPRSGIGFKICLKVSTFEVKFLIFSSYAIFRVPLNMLNTIALLSANAAKWQCPIRGRQLCDPVGGPIAEHAPGLDCDQTV